MVVYFIWRVLANQRRRKNAKMGTSEHIVKYPSLKVSKREAKWETPLAIGNLVGFDVTMFAQMTATQNTLIKLAWAVQL